MGNTEGKSDQPAPENLTHLLAPLQALQNLFAAFNNRRVIIGGFAASLLGTPRYTVDLDAVFLLSFDDLPRLLTEAAVKGIVPRIPDPIRFARKSRVILLRHTPSGIDIDLSLGILPFEIEMVGKSQVIDVGVMQFKPLWNKEESIIPRRCQ